MNDKKEIDRLLDFKDLRNNKANALHSHTEETGEDSSEN